MRIGLSVFSRNTIVLAVSRIDNETMVCDECGTMEALDSLPYRILTPQERTRIAVAAKRNKWATENFNITHNYEVKHD